MLLQVSEGLGKLETRSRRRRKKTQRRRSSTDMQWFDRVNIQLPAESHRMTKTRMGLPHEPEGSKEKNIIRETRKAMTFRRETQARVVRRVSSVCTKTDVLNSAEWIVRDTSQCRNIINNINISA